MADTLTIGTLSAVAASPTSTTITLSAAPSGGSGSGYSVTLYRDVTEGFTPSDTNKVAINLGTTHTDTGLTANTKYYYIAEATDSSSDTASSNEASVTTEAYPAMTIGAVSAAVASATSATVSLAAGPAGGSGTGLTTTLWRSTDPGMAQGSQTHQVGKNLTFPYTDTGLTPGDEVYYMVVGSDDSGNTVNSNIANATPTELTMGTLTATAVSANEIDVTLSAAPTGGSGTGFKTALYRDVTEGFVPSAANQIAASLTAGTAYKDTTVSAGTQYYYEAEATDSANDVASATATATTPAAPLTAPTLTVTVTSDTSAEIALSAAVSGGTAPITANLYRGTTSGFSIADSDPLFTDVTFPHTDHSLEPDQAYFYIAQFTDADGNTTTTAVAGTTTPSDNTVAAGGLTISAPAVYGVVDGRLQNPPVTVTGNVGDYTILAGPILPPGVSFSTAKGWAGPATATWRGKVTLKVIDSSNASASVQTDVIIYPELSVVAPVGALPRSVGGDYDYIVTAKGGLGQLIYSITGLTVNGKTVADTTQWPSIDASMGQISGYRNTAAIVAVNVAVTDGADTATGTIIFDYSSGIPVPPQSNTAALPGLVSKGQAAFSAFIAGRTATTPNTIQSAQDFVTAMVFLCQMPYIDFIVQVANAYSNTTYAAIFDDTAIQEGMSGLSAAQVKRAMAVHAAFKAVYITKGNAARRYAWGQLMAATCSPRLVHYLRRAAASTAW